MRVPITLVGTHIPGYMQERGMGGWSATIILALIGFSIYLELWVWVI